MHRRLAVPLGVGVFNVVMDQRGLVEALDRHGHLSHLGADRTVGVAPAQGAEHARRQQRAPPLAVSQQPLPRHLLGSPLCGAEHLSNHLRREPGVHHPAQGLQVQTPRVRLAREMNRVPYPGHVDGRVGAAVAQQRYRHPRNRPGLHVRVDPLEHVQATNADDALDLPASDQGHDHGGPLGDQDDVAEGLGGRLHVVDDALAAVLADQAQLVNVRRAVLGAPETLGQQEQPPVKRNPRQRVAPQFVVQQDADIAAKLRGNARLSQQVVRAGHQLVQAQRRHEGLSAGKIAGTAQNAIPRLARGWNLRLHAPHAVNGQRDDV